MYHYELAASVLALIFGIKVTVILTHGSSKSSVQITKAFSYVHTVLVYRFLLWAVAYYGRNIGSQIPQSFLMELFNIVSYYPLLFLVSDLVFKISNAGVMKKVTVLSQGISIGFVFINLIDTLFNNSSSYYMLYFSYVSLFTGALIFFIIILASNYTKTNNKRESIFLITVFLVYIPINIIHCVDKDLAILITSHFMIIYSITLFLFLYTKKTMPQEVIYPESFTKREVDITKLLFKGHSYQEIASIENIALSTVKTHVYNIYKKQTVANRYQLLNKLSTAPKL